MTRGPAWSAAEEDTLRELLSAASLVEIARRLHRSVEAVRVRKKRLGLRQTTDFLTLAEVARVMGVDRQLARRWVADGHLPARRSRLRSGPARLWRVEVEQLSRFISRHPERYDYRRVCEEPFRAQARDAYRRDPCLTVPEAAKRLGCAEETTRRWLRSGRLAGVQVPRQGGAGGMWLVRASALPAGERAS